ncbi:hypothetical protein ABZX93_35090 [Streptomyces sp. NPDC006632]|uniref:hypothetical protein n=1 Tax=Streptomyces sp. NPDC006632 TaxID=3157182 RepID=UPI00339F5268
MIRLPASSAAVTTPLVSSVEDFPGISIGRSLLDGRPFHLSPAMVDSATLQMTSSLGMGGLGSGKSTTGKIRGHREIRDNGHQYVVLDSHGEDGLTGEWAPMTRHVGGLVIEASSFTLNPCSAQFSPGVREQLIRSLILAVEPDALTTEATHALQHALNNPKATDLNGLVEALVDPQNGRWPAAKLAEYGMGPAMALTWYTDGALRGLFDGQDSNLPPTDKPFISFDFTRLDRNSPAITSLMAAIGCWVENIWLRESKAVHKHFVLEEAWQILLSPSTSELIQRLLKYSRRNGLSLDVLMHTLSDLGNDGTAKSRAEDLARLCQVLHIGRLGPEDAALVGTIFGLDQWVVDRIPNLGPGEAVWKVGSKYVDIVKTVITEEEERLTDTSSRRRAAQQVGAPQEQEQEQEQPAPEPEPEEETEPLAGSVVLSKSIEEAAAPAVPADESEWDWAMPPTVIDARHHAAVQAAQEGRYSEAADLAAIGERQDITAHGIMSDQAVEWLSTRARVAELGGKPETATHLRATVHRMGKEVNWWSDARVTGQPPADNSADLSAAPQGEPEPPARARRPRWPIAVVAGLVLATVVVWRLPSHDEQARDQKAASAAYKGVSRGSFVIDDVNAYVSAEWSSDKTHVILECGSYYDPDAKFLRIDAADKTAQSARPEGADYPKPPEIEIPVNDPKADVTVRITIGGKSWQSSASRGFSKEVRLSPSGVAYDAATGEKLPNHL